MADVICTTTQKDERLLLFLSLFFFLPLWGCVSCRIHLYGARASSRRRRKGGRREEKTSPEDRQRRVLAGVRVRGELRGVRAEVEEAEVLVVSWWRFDGCLTEKTSRATHGGKAFPSVRGIFLKSPGS